MSILVEESLKRKKKRDDALPTSDVYSDEFNAYQSSFAGVLDLQQGLDTNDESDYFRLGDLAQALPNVDRVYIDSVKSFDYTTKFCSVLQDRPCRGALPKTMSKPSIR